MTRRCLGTAYDMVSDAWVDTYELADGRRYTVRRPLREGRGHKDAYMSDASLDRYERELFGVDVKERSGV